MNDYIVDDRLDLVKLCQELDAMSEKEQKAYIEKHDRSNENPL